MRDFKFRAWDKHRKVMSDPFTLLQCRPTVGGKPIGIQLAVDQIFMQFTSLCDCNGQEAYEGDVVKARDQIGQIVWERFGWHVFWPNGIKVCPAPYYSRLADVSSLEVIGDIYRTPHLLEPT